MTIDENTSNPDDVRRALAAARLGSRRTDRVVTEARREVSVTRELSQADHFTNKLRRIIQGAA